MVEKSWQAVLAEEGRRREAALEALPDELKQAYEDAVRNELDRARQSCRQLLKLDDLILPADGAELRPPVRSRLSNGEQLLGAHLDRPRPWTVAQITEAWGNCQNVREDIRRAYERIQNVPDVH